ncbi:MAG: IS1595 family transposase, partial [Arenibacter algicola]|nr:IS1595 family transposase [Arenibacter algicola]
TRCSNSYKTAWLLLHKLRRAMAADGDSLSGLVEVDETTMTFRTKEEFPGGGQGRSPIGKIVLAGAVEVSEDGDPRRIKVAAVGGYGTESLHGFVRRHVAEGSTVKTDGNPSYRGLRKRHVDAYLAEFAFRWNRMRSYETAFDALLGMGMDTSPTTYRDIVAK